MIRIENFSFFSFWQLAQGFGLLVAGWLALDFYNIVPFGIAELPLSWLAESKQDQTTEMLYEHALKYSQKS